MMRMNYGIMASTMKDSYERESLCSETFIVVRNEMGNYASGWAFEAPNRETIMQCMEMFSFLRNACIYCKRNQDLILDAGTLDTCHNFLRAILDPSFIFGVQEKGLLQKLARTVVQFFGNLVVQNKRCQDAFWSLAFPKLFFDLFANLDGDGKEALCMVVYNCMRDRKNFFVDEAEAWLMSCVIDHCRTHEKSEWGWLVLELVVSSSQFGALYQMIDNPDSRYVLLEVCHAHLEDDKSTVNIGEEGLLCLADQFRAKSACILRLAKEVTEELGQESRLLVKSLSVLCAATSYRELYPGLRGCVSLLECAIDLLNDVSSETLSAFFSRPAVPEGNVSPNIATGFKRDLIRLIGNMSYRNRANQDKVRERNGILPILNSCNIDDCNPYILQWAIFAVRNLCEENLENQHVLASLEGQGLARNEFVSQSNILVRMENGKVRVLPKER